MQVAFEFNHDYTHIVGWMCTCLSFSLSLSLSLSLCLSLYVYICDLICKKGPLLSKRLWPDLWTNYCQNILNISVLYSFFICLTVYFSRSGPKCFDRSGPFLHIYIHIYIYIYKIVTQYYKCPEVSLHTSYSKTVDIWSVGCSLVEMYIGR